MLLRLLRTHLAPYKPWLAAIVVLQFTATVAMLYLPSLNADIIDQGVAVGDTDYILHTGAVMLGVSLLQIVCSIVAVACASRTAMSFGRDLRAALFHRVGAFSGREVAQFGAPSLITRNTNDVTAGADARAAGLLPGRAGADHDGRRDRDGDARGPRPVVAARDRGARAVPLRRFRRLADGAELPAGAEPHRRREPDPARADQRHPGGARVRPRAPRDPAVRRGERRPDRGLDPGRPLDGDHVPAGDARGEHLQRRGDLVRRSPGQRRSDAGRGDDRVPELPDADPHERDDGDVHAHADPALGGVRGPHQRGAGHPAERRTSPRRCRRARPPRRARPGRRLVHLPGRGAAGALRRQLQRPPGPDRRDHRLDRRRQVHAGQPGAEAVRRDLRLGAGRRRRRP